MHTLHQWRRQGNWTASWIIVTLLVRKLIGFPRLWFYYATNRSCCYHFRCGDEGTEGRVVGGIQRDRGEGGKKGMIWGWDGNEEWQGWRCRKKAENMAERTESFVLWKPKWQSLSAEETLQLVVVRHHHTCVFLCMRENVLHRTFGDRHTSWILFSPRIPHHTQRHTCVCVHTLSCEGFVNAAEQDGENRSLWGGGGGGGGRGIGGASQGMKSL